MRNPQTKTARLLIAHSDDTKNALVKTSAKLITPGGSHPTRSATARWGGRSALFNEGFVSVPNRFLRRYSALNPPLTPGEALFVLQLMTFKWESAAPFPSYKRLAKAMGVTDKMTRRYAQGLQKKGYLVRQFQYQAPNKFDLTGLFQALAEAPATK